MSRPLVIDLFLQAAESKCLSTFIQGMQETICAEIIPECKACLTCQGGKHHNENVMTHLVLTTQAAEKLDYHTDLIIACFLHDIGKPVTVSVGLTGELTFYSHEVIGASIAYGIARRLGLNETRSLYIKNIVRHHMFHFPEDVSDRTIRRWLTKVGMCWYDLLLLRAADRAGNLSKQYLPSWTTQMDQLYQHAKGIIRRSNIIFPEQLVVSKEEIKQIVGKRSGEAIPSLVEICNSYPQRNTKEWILKYLKKVYTNDNTST